MKSIYRNFGVFSNILESLVGKNANQIASLPPQTPLEGHNSIERAGQLPKLNLTRFSNGVRVLTESSIFPSNVNMGVLIDAGTRDETMYNSGVCFALKNVFLKTNERTNEQLNYGMIQMSGGEWSCEHSNEHIMYKGHFLSHDCYDFIQMLSDMVFDDRTLIDEECALWRVDEYWKLRELNQSNIDKIDNLWLTLAYGPKGLGMPLNGYQSKFQNVGMRAMNEFRRQHITTDRITVVAAGINNHEEFVEAVRPYFEAVEAKGAPEREKSKYIGGELIEMDEDDMTSVHISFKGVPWTHELAPASNVLKTLVGGAGLFSTGGPGKGMHSRSYTHFMSKYPFLESVQSLNKNFTDSGNFGINVLGSSSQAQSLPQCAAKELADLVNVTDQEVSRAKNLLKIQCLLALEKTGDRIEDLARNNSVFGLSSNLLQKVDSVTTDQVRKFAASLFKSPMTYIVMGGDTHGVPSADRISSHYFK